ncbi:MAG: transcription elongation factor GreA [Candidatus Magasanikbacteria bacterium]|nr:transcription elongation factor GreA [Candidatus Magasanikbacteria bacterium]
MTDQIQFMTQEKFDELEKELRQLKNDEVPRIAKRIDEARQMGDLSENAEYHSAREEMAWIQSRVKEIQHLLSDAEIISAGQKGGIVTVGSTIVVESKNGRKDYIIVGAQEANPTLGKISNESPLGSAFLGRIKGDKVKVQLPSGVQEYKILEVK